MARRASGNELVLGGRRAGVRLGDWLYQEIRSAILSGRLGRGVLLPATRELAEEQGVSRRLVVTAYERLKEEGYLSSVGGSGTRVSESVPEDFASGGESRKVAPEEERLPEVYRRPARAFRPIEPALDEFPVEVWGKAAVRVLRRASVKTLAGGDALGMLELRRAIVAYLGTSRGLSCRAGNVIVTSGTQQSLDLLARVLLQPGDSVWMEDPGYVGATEAFQNAGAKIVAVRVDEHGLNFELGKKLCAKPKLVYLTPAHQFGMGVTLSLERRFALLRWARENQVAVLEDDYDSEFRFRGRPVPAMKGMAGGDAVVLMGSFNKVLFPSLRLGYVVAPDVLVERIVRLRFQTDRYPAAIPQAILARFMEEGHFARHLRRMRMIYAERCEVLVAAVEKQLDGILRLPEIQAGLNTPAFLENGMSSREASLRAAAENIEAWPLDRFALRRRDLRGLLLGFAAFRPREIRAGVEALARALGN